MSGRRLTRREILTLAGAAGVAGAGYLVVRSLPGDESATPSTPDSGPDGPAPTAEPDSPVTRPDGVPSALWSDPATWGGEVPGEGDVAVVDRPILLDVDASVAGVRIEPAGDLVFDPAARLRLRSTGNIVVHGRLQLHPADPRIVHEIEFIDVDESRFRGGHTDTPFDEDVGLWVMGAGLLDARGSNKTSWTHLTGEAAAGDRTITVDDAEGWRAGDEIVVTPTEPATVTDHFAHHDRRTIESVDGTEIRLDEPLDHPHPSVTVREGVTHRAEVLNLTRNVLLQGTPDGRSHVIMHATTEPQNIGYVGLRHMGPRKGDEEVLGRYAIHFHADDDGSRGSIVEGVVAYDSTGHGFAAHLSNGVTFRDCIAHDMVDDAFWWDLSLDGGGRHLVPSHGIVYERCVASFVKSGGNSRFNLTGFLMGAGEGNIARGCVATGVQGHAESSAGFHWPSHSRDDNTWTFEDNIAHNNAHSGIYFWQNGAPRTIVTGFTAYQNDQGIFAGSYSNLASYRDCTIYACTKAGLIISALPARKGRRTGETITYEGMYVDQAGLTEYAVTITKHLSRGASDRVTLIQGGTFRGGTKAQIGIPEGGDHPQYYDIVDCTFDGNEFWLADSVPADTRLRVQGGETGSFVVLRADQPGEPRPEWNASVGRD
jgi:Right handed beta helix region